MTNPIDAVRAALRSLADEGKPIDLGTRALAGMRRRRRTAAVAGISVVVLAAGSLTWPLWPDDPPTTPETATTLYYSDGETVLARFGPDPVGLDSAGGLIVNHVLAELSADASVLSGQSWESIRAGGYQITTTIDVDAQQVLNAAVGSAMNGQPSNLKAAGVVVEPGTGRVLAYYGGTEGNDFAGVYIDEDGSTTGYGYHVPGSSFFVYTVAAALKSGYSLNSRWQWTEHEQRGRGAGLLNPVGSRCEGNPTGDTCSLLDSVTSSLNIPIYDVTVSVGESNVLAMARDAGIGMIWDDTRKRIDLRTTAPETATNQSIGAEVGFGQYPVTVVDQANAMATFAAGGIRAQAHFVRTVSRRDQILYGETLPTPDATPVLESPQIADLTYALTQASGDADIAMKAGSWEIFSPFAQAWSIGYTRALGTAIWIGSNYEWFGNPRDPQSPVIDRDGNPLSGSTLPTQVLREVIDGTQQRLGLNPTAFPPPAFAGNLNPPGSRPS